MKKLLFLGLSLNIGGAEKSLVNLLNMIDYSEYEVDLLLFKRQGPLMKQIPDGVNLIKVHEIDVLFQSVKETVGSKKFTAKDLWALAVRYFATFKETMRWKQYDQIRLNRWIDYYSSYIPRLDKEYDVAIAYAGGETAYYMLDKVEAERKVYYFHSDYSKINIDANKEKQYVDRANRIITISDTCKNSLVKLFPEKKEEIFVLQNLSSSKLIKKMAEEYVPDEFLKEDGLKIVSVGRLHEIKGYDMAIDAAKKMMDSGYKFKWVVVGEGEERANLEKQIQKNGLSERFILVGIRENPYPYIKSADILAQTSRFEGKSVVLDEAKILKTPVLATDYNSAHDQICDGKDGVIVEMSADGISRGIMELDQEKISKLKANIEVAKTLEDIEAYMNCLLKD